MSLPQATWYRLPMAVWQMGNLKIGGSSNQGRLTRLSFTALWSALNKLADIGSPCQHHRGRGPCVDRGDTASAAIYRIIPKKWPNVDGHFRHPGLPVWAPVARLGRLLALQNKLSPAVVDDCWQRSDIMRHRKHWSKTIEG
jgi:hypothetical protein